MKHYRSMRFMSGVLRVLGWLIFIFGCLFAYPNIEHLIRIPGVSDDFHLRMVFLGGGMALTGLFIVAAGQAISALADMASNSWRLREIAENSKPWHSLSSPSG